MEKIIQTISKRRKEKGFTYENIAFELDISPGAYRKIEIGETKLTIDRLFKISKILELPIIDLLLLHSDFIDRNVKNESPFNDKDFLIQLVKSKDEHILLLKELLNLKNN